MEYVEPARGLPPEYQHLGVPEMLKLAEYHERLAKNLHRRVKHARSWQLVFIQADQRAEELSTSYTVVLEHLKRLSLDDAIKAAAGDLNAPEMTIRAWWKIFLRNRDSAARAARDAVILQLVQCGLTNAEISERVGVSANTVSRAVGARLHGDLRPADRQRLRKRRKKPTTRGERRGLPGK